MNRRELLKLLGLGVVAPVAVADALRPEPEGGHKCRYHGEEEWNFKRWQPGTRSVDALMVGGETNGHTLPVREDCNSLTIPHYDDYGEFAPQEYVRRDDGCFVFVSDRDSQ